MQRWRMPKHLLKCDKCGHTWESTSTHKYVSCPSCLGKTKNTPLRTIPVPDQAEKIPAGSVFCIYCGEKNRQDAAFCYKCGKKIK